MDATIETCENCGRAIGKLETPRVWQDRVVCGECMPRLSGVPQAVELTAKRWKRQMLIGWAIFGAGIVLAIAGAAMMTADELAGRRIGTAGGLVMLGGFAWYAYASLRAWWERG